MRKPIFKLYEQQQYMYRNKVHSVPERIVSIRQSWICPIVRGKIKVPVEFGAKLDVSIDEEGYGRLEKVSFDAYNERGCLIEAVERYSHVRAIILSVYWQTRFTGSETTALTVKNMGYGCQVQSLADRPRMPKRIRSRNIRITGISLAAGT